MAAIGFETLLITKPNFVVNTTTLRLISRELELDSSESGSFTEEVLKGFLQVLKGLECEVRTDSGILFKPSNIATIQLQGGNFATGFGWLRLGQDLAKVFPKLRDLSMVNCGLLGTVDLSSLKSLNALDLTLNPGIDEVVVAKEPAYIQPLSEEIQWYQPSKRHREKTLIKIHPAFLTAAKRSSWGPHSPNAIDLRNERGETATPPRFLSPALNNMKKDTCRQGL